MAQVRIKKRVAIPALLLVLIAGMFGRAVARGTMTGAPVDPKGAADGVVCGLVAGEGGGKPARCAVVIDKPLEQVLGVLTDYQHYGEVFPYLAEVKGVREADGSDRLSGVASSPVLHSWPFDLHLRHSKTATGHVISWDDPGGKLKRNAGHWTLTRVGSGGTLAAYTLDIQISHYPGFIVRDVLLNRMPAVLTALKQRLG